MKSPKRKARSKPKAGIWYVLDPEGEGWAFVSRDKYGTKRICSGYSTKKRAMAGAKFWHAGR